jgi:hypothetical protein
MASATRQSLISKACCLLAFIIASSSSYAQGFSSSQVVPVAIASYSPHTSALFANGGKGFGPSSSSNNNNNNNNNSGSDNKKKGKRPKYTIEDKSYGSSSLSSSFTENVNNQTPEEFFTTYNEWMPLFRKYQQHSLAHSFLATNNNDPSLTNNDVNLWGISTLENRNPGVSSPPNLNLPYHWHILVHF